MKFAICNEVFEGWTIDESIRFVAETGYDAIEIAPFTLSQYVTEVPVAERHRIRAVADDNGIEISAVHWVLIKTEGMYMTHTDPAVRRSSGIYCRGSALNRLGSWRRRRSLRRSSWLRTRR